MVKNSKKYVLADFERLPNNEKKTAETPKKFEFRQQNKL